MYAKNRFVYLPVKLDTQHYSVKYILCIANPDIISQFPYICTTYLKCATKYNAIYILICAVSNSVCKWKIWCNMRRIAFKYE